MEKILGCTVRKQNTSIMLISGIVLISHYILFKFMMQLNSQYNLLEVTSPAMQIEFFQQSTKPEEKIPQLPKKTVQKIVQQPKTVVKQTEPIQKIIKPVIEKEQKSILTTKQDIQTHNIVQQQSMQPITPKLNNKPVEKLEEVKELDKQVKSSDIQDNTKNDTKLANNSLGKNNSTDIKDSAPKIGASSNSQYMGGKPHYPEYAEENSIEGTVTLNVLVGADGKAKKVILNKSSGESILDNSAIKHVQGTGNTFKPMIKDGNPVEAWITFAIKFKLD